MATTILRAEDVPAPVRLGYWRELLSSRITPLEFALGEAATFRAQMQSDDLGSVVVSTDTSPPGACWSTRKLIKRSDGDRFTVAILRRGQGILDHAGRQSPTRPGDFVVVDNSRLFRHSHSAMEHVTVSFSRQLIPAVAPSLAEVAGFAFDGSDRASALFSSFARKLPRVVDGLDPEAKARLGTTLLDLLTVALTDRLDPSDGRAADARERTLLTRIYAFTEERIGDPDLSPASIAAAHHVSLRYLHRLFQAEGTTVSSWIRRRRLERTRRELLDPLLAERPVAAIAARWGFSRAAHFSRVFSAANGVPPGEFRARFNAAAR